MKPIKEKLHRSKKQPCCFTSHHRTFVAPPKDDSYSEFFVSSASEYFSEQIRTKFRNFIKTIKFMSQIVNSTITIIFFFHFEPIFVRVLVLLTLYDQFLSYEQILNQKNDYFLPL